MERANGGPDGEGGLDAHLTNAGAWVGLLTGVEVGSETLALRADVHSWQDRVTHRVGTLRVRDGGGDENSEDSGEWGSGRRLVTT